MTQEEFESLLADGSKTLQGDIEWQADEDHSPAVEFQAPIISQSGLPIELRGTYNQKLEKLSYAIILRGVGRIYALDMGQDHRNPDGQFTGEIHKHRWTVLFRDKEAYVPNDITEPSSNPLAVWQQFCTEFNLVHNGIMHAPPPIQGIIDL